MRRILAQLDGRSLAWRAGLEVEFHVLKLAEGIAAQDHIAMPEPRLRGRIEDKGCDRQVIGTPGLTCEGRHHRGILEHLLQGVLPCVSKARSL